MVGICKHLVSGLWHAHVHLQHVQIGMRFAHVARIFMSKCLLHCYSIAHVLQQVQQRRIIFEVYLRGNSVYNFGYK